MPRPIIIIQESPMILEKTKSFEISAYSHRIKVDKWWLEDAEKSQYEEEYNIHDEKLVKARFTETQWDYIIEFIKELD